MPGRSKIRLLFLHPKTLFDSWPFPVDTLGEIVKVPSLIYPLLASTVSAMPFDVEIFDGYVAPASFRDYKARLARADVIAITVMTPLKALDTEVTIRLARRLNPSVKVVLGGNQASAFAERWVELGVDFVVVREGERAFPRLMQLLAEGAQSFEDVPNLVYRDASGAVRRTTAALPDMPLDDSPIPAWERMDLTPYRHGFGAGGPAATLEISRGCPHRCDFCNINRFWDYKQRYKSVDRVLDELDRLERLGVRQVFFADDNFGHDHAHTVELLESIVRRGYGMSFGGFIRGDTVARHPEFASIASRAGLRLALMGIETLDSRWLKDHKKGVASRDMLDMWRRVYRTMKANGVYVVGLFINPTHAGAARSGAGLDGVVCDYHYSADLLPQKNSVLFDNMVRDKRLEVKDMFYHDWNMPASSIGGAAQENRKSLRHALGEVDLHTLRAMGSTDRMDRHFYWGNLAVFFERLLCTTADDLYRYRIAKNEELSVAERQQRIIESMANDETLDRLVVSPRWKGPLAIRLAVAGLLGARRRAGSTTG
ncbi:radical SAM protein [Sorangium sp. So ce321]|uniref:B12-binding domain-containing radical SAM protein n=1 Tax=Sorangium sp. So ce321 TaxID=3133300 RepID=UPI003F5F2ACE